jgi:hypothetical protein
LAALQEEGLVDLFGDNEVPDLFGPVWKKKRILLTSLRTMKFHIQEQCSSNHWMSLTQDLCSESERQICPLLETDVCHRHGNKDNSLNIHDDHVISLDHSLCLKQSSGTLYAANLEGFPKSDDEDGYSKKATEEGFCPEFEEVNIVDHMDIADLGEQHDNSFDVHHELELYFKQSRDRFYMLHFDGPPLFDGEDLAAQEDPQVMGTGEQPMAVPNHDKFAAQKSRDDLRIYEKHKEGSPADDVQELYIWQGQGQMQVLRITHPRQKDRIGQAYIFLTIMQIGTN